MEDKEGFPEEVACEECWEGCVAARVWGEGVGVVGKSWLRERYEQGREAEWIAYVKILNFWL